MERYTQAQLTWVKENLAEMLHFFGYAKLPSDPENETGFFEFKAKIGQDAADFELQR